MSLASYVPRFYDFEIYIVCDSFVKGHYERCVKLMACIEAAINIPYVLYILIDICRRAYLVMCFMDRIQPISGWVRGMCKSLFFSSCNCFQQGYDRRAKAWINLKVKKGKKTEHKLYSDGFCNMLVPPFALLRLI